GPEEALQRLDALAAGQGDEGEGPSAEDARLRDDLRRLYANYAQKQDDAGKVLAPQQREWLRAELGWFGELALAPKGAPDEDARRQAVAPARRVAEALIAGVLGGLALATVGVVGLLVLLILMANGTARRGFVPGSPHGAVYAE